MEYDFKNGDVVICIKPPKNRVSKLKFGGFYHVTNVSEEYLGLYKLHNGWNKNRFIHKDDWVGRIKHGIQTRG